jgi:Ca2+/Na+ antiporter
MAHSIYISIHKIKSEILTIQYNVFLIKLVFYWLFSNFKQKAKMIQNCMVIIFLAICAPFIPFFSYFKNRKISTKSYSFSNSRFEIKFHNSCLYRVSHTGAGQLHGSFFGSKGWGPHWGRAEGVSESI